MLFLCDNNPKAAHNAELIAWRAECVHVVAKHRSQPPIKHAAPHVAVVLLARLCVNVIYGTALFIARVS